MTLQDRKDLIDGIQNNLTALVRDVCPHCAAESPLYCEVIDGQHQHVAGVCVASPIRELKTHLDDVRDQFANEFNAEQQPRAHWAAVGSSVLALEKAMRDFAEHGLRCDLQPTKRMPAAPTPEQAANNERWWQEYLGAADANVRDRAKKALRRR